MFDWDDLRHFAALADHGSLSAAARRLKVEHATVARRIAALEAAAGAKLVDRRGGRYVLTPDGERVADHARRMNAEALAIERALRAGRGEEAVEVSVSAPPLFVTHLIAPRLGVLKRAHPRLRLHLLGESRTASLSGGEADLAVRLSRPTDGALVVRRVGTVTYRLYADAAYLDAHPAAERGFIAFDESLDGAPHQVWLKAMAGERPIVFRTNDLGIQCAAAKAGVGIAALPGFVGTAAGLAEADPDGRSFSRDVWLAFHRDLRDNPAVSAVASYLAECLRPGGPPPADPC